VNPTISMTVADIVADKERERSFDHGADGLHPQS
jgi:hypothetical protein